MSNPKFKKAVQLAFEKVIARKGVIDSTAQVRPFIFEEERDDLGNCPGFSFEEMSQYELVELADKQGYLCLFQEPDYGWLHFAVLDWVQGEPGTPESRYNLVFRGRGFSDGLWELRHTWWGRDGYLFYPNGAVISEAFQALRQFFDVPGWDVLSKDE